MSEEIPEPHAYVTGFLEQKYDEVLPSLAEDPAQARLAFGALRTTLLHAAAYDGKPEIAKALLELGADVNAQEINGFTPLHLACINGCVDVIDLLLRSGADPYIPDSNGSRPLERGRAARGGRSEEVIAMFRRFGIVDEREGA